MRWIETLAAARTVKAAATALALMTALAGGPGLAADDRESGMPPPPAAASARPAAAKEAAGTGIFSLLPPRAVTDHRITAAGRNLDYQAKAGTLALLGGDGAETARIFYTAYTLKPEGAAPAAEALDPAASRRPITFVFNGGPGAASAYLHLGALGPRILKTAPDGGFLPPPQAVEDNPDTWLSMTDLVFVDPVGTGYSRAAPGNKEEDFWGVDADAQAMGAFIRLYLQEAGRTASPVYLAGESYGGFRAARLAKSLQADIGIGVNGVVLISPALEFAFVYPDEFSPLHYALELPAMAAVRLEREGVSGDELRQRLAGVERYAMTDYLTALAGGLEAGGKAATPEVARITGLPEALVAQHYARISTSLFAREVARGEGAIASRYDGSITTADIAPDQAYAGTPDPILDRSIPVMTSAFVDYVRNELGYRTPVSYRLLNGEISRKWDYGGSGRSQGYAGVMDDLQEARALNPAMRVLIVHGFTDLTTPYPVSKFLVDQLPTLKGAEPIRLRTYEGGHMMYLRPDSRRQLKDDAAELYAEPS